ncbi:uncharacterized protein LOC122668203 [Telopea speciosissima]|uniref:uncharacterized protein LOC122668203 n=1 Tax=Telopea speciosissima TaxID=54955 RepID=UPI001CC6FDDA|nr:uncharacterized protein LOC122668203 [Telopea speciosissima]
MNWAVAIKTSVSVFWCPPFSSLKLNVDGACKGNPGVGGGGGIIRNTEGRVIAAFANFYGECTNSIANLRVLRDGLKLCESLGIKDFHVNSDSAATVQCIAKRKCEFWKGWYWFQEVLGLINFLKPMISFTYREGNRAAGFLANLACDSKKDTVFHGESSLHQNL